MTKKYIKNCTGDHCETKAVNSGIVSRIIFFTLSVLFLAALIYILFFSQYLKIVNVTVDGNQELGSQELQQVIDSSLQKNFLGFIPGNNFMFISQGNIEKLLIDNFKKIRSVSVVKGFPDTINITIDERKALLVWCSGENCYLLDENGVAYSMADFSSPELIQNNLLQINDGSGRDVKIGEKIIEQSYEQYVLSIKDALLPIGFEATGQYSTPSRMADEIRVKTKQETEFYFSTQFSQESALKVLATILKKEITKDQIGNVEYIDLRNENKVFYKAKNVEPALESQQVTSAEAQKEEKKK